MTFVWIILSVICIVYGLMVKAVGSGSMFFAVWLGLGVIFALLAVLTASGFWAKLPGELRIVMRTAVIVILAVFIIVEAMAASGFGAQGSRGLDYIVVLGAQVKESGPSSVLRFRLDKAKEYLEENPDTMCILSGGQGANEPCPEAEEMARYMENAGVAADRLIIENESENTVQNIVYSMKKADLENSSVGIVTNNFHVFRAVRIAKKQGIDGAEGIAAESTLLYLPNNMFREFFGIAKDLIKGNM